MPNRWITFVKKWASDNNIAYGCALSKPELKVAYNKQYPKQNKLPKGIKKLQESSPPQDVKSKVTYPNVNIVIPPQENIQFNIEESAPVMKAKRGRPQKHMTDEEKYKAKLESNKQKRREKAAAKKIEGYGNIPLPSRFRVQPEHVVPRQVQVAPEQTTIVPTEARLVQNQFQEIPIAQATIIPMNRRERERLQRAHPIYTSGQIEEMRAKYDADMSNPENRARLEGYIAMTSKKPATKRHLRGGMVSDSDEDDKLRGELNHYGLNLSLLDNIAGSKKDKAHDIHTLGASALHNLNMLKNPIKEEIAMKQIGDLHGSYNSIFINDIKKLPGLYKYHNIPTK